jgi:hypothetical protein
MNDIDDKILAAIQAETEQSLEEYQEELGLFGLIGESFKGAFKWVVIGAIIMILVFAGLVVYSGINFYHASDIALKLNWFAAGLVAFIIFAILRLWFFMELNRLSIKREIKRVELQVSLLATKIDGLIGR